MKKLLENRFFAESKLPRDKIKIPPHSRDRLAFEAERAKIKLSEALDASVEVFDFCQHSDKKHNLAAGVSRADFESLIASAVDKAMEQVNLVLEKGGVNQAEVDLVLMIGGTSLIPLVTQRMREVFGARVVRVPNAATIIAEGAAIVSWHDWLPSLVYPVCVLLADNTLYPVYPEGTVLYPEATRKKLTLFCTDPRDGDGRLIIVEGKDRSPIGRGSKTLVAVPVTPTVPKSDIERVYAEFSFDQNLVLNVEAYGSIARQVVRDQVFDLCFGLSVGVTADEGGREGGQDVK